MSSPNTIDTTSEPRLSGAAPLFGEWQPIATIPDNVDVLVTCGGICSPAVARWSDAEQCYYDGDDDDCPIEPEDWPLSHWMPLPPPPPNDLRQARAAQGVDDVTD